MKENKNIKILFIGNSHTYFHDLPARVALLAQEQGYSCETVMLAHGGWYLKKHMREPEARFNIRYGHYDYVVLQEHSHPFDCIPDYLSAAETLSAWIRGAGGTPVIYGTWAKKDEEFAQAEMNAVNRKLAEDLGAVYAPVGESWWTYLRSYPEIEMYEEDGAHASEKGMDFAAKILWTSIQADLSRKQ